jgi:hypothetical protein
MNNNSVVVSLRLLPKLLTSFNQLRLTGDMHQVEREDFMHRIIAILACLDTTTNKNIISTNDFGLQRSQFGLTGSIR